MKDIKEFIDKEFVCIRDEMEFEFYDDITNDDLEKLIELCQEELAQRASDAQD